MSVRITFVCLLVSVLAFGMSSTTVNGIKEEEQLERQYRSALLMMLLKTGTTEEEYMKEVGPRNPMHQIFEERRATRPERLANAQHAQVISLLGFVAAACTLPLLLFGATPDTVKRMFGFMSLFCSLMTGWQQVKILLLYNQENVMLEEVVKLVSLRNGWLMVASVALIMTGIMCVIDRIYKKRQSRMLRES